MNRLRSRSRWAIAMLATFVCLLRPAHAEHAEDRVAVHLDPPSGWTRVAFEPPDLSQAPQIAQGDFRAWGPPEGDARIVSACFVAETGTWTEEAEPLALDKIAQMASSTALRIRDVGALRATSTARTGAVVSQRLEATGGEHGEGAARSFLGFLPGRVVGCFALCIGPSRVACMGSVESAHMEGAFVPPPPPTLGVRVMMGAVHHPKGAALLAGALALLGGVLAIVTRKRPRRRRQEDASRAP